MEPQKSNMTVLAQIVKQIPAKIIDSLAKKFRIQTRAFSFILEQIVQFFQCLILDLTDPFPGPADHLTDLFECSRTVSVQTEPQFQNQLGDRSLFQGNQADTAAVGLHGIQ